MRQAEFERRHSAHYHREMELFKLPPWHTAPVNAGGNPPDPSDMSGGARTWAAARALRDQLLAANPDHYRDLEE